MARMTKEERAEKKRKEAEQKARMEKHYAETRAIVEAGVCPRCGSKVKRNLSMKGWWQCEQFGAEHFRARPQDPQCGWDGFTE